ncbi:PAS domain S-box protein [Limnoglobus roseus]|uniref:PAS domain S-box protein n=1 Tax=Limnoglobus roseus TaxID=2598579 RepID=UPI00143DE931|nr:PAS domain S-box protein [Limnoglobus roseus]
MHDAVERAGEFNAQLVLLDRALDQGRVAQRIRDRFSIPVILLTDSPTEGQEPLSYVSKPTTARELSLVIEAVASRGRGEQALAAQRRLLVATLRSMADGIVTTDPQGRITYLNPQAETLSGWTLDEARDRRFEDVINILDERTRQPIALPAMEDITGKRVRSLGEHMTLVTRSGRELPIADSIAPVRGDAGEQLGCVLVFHDATKERAALREATNLAAIIASSQDGISVFAADGTVTAWNPAAERIYGYRADEMIGRPVFVAAPPGEEATMRALHSRMVASGTNTSFEAFRRRKDGSLVELSVALFPIRNAAGDATGYGAIFRDITQLRQLQQQFRQAQKMESIGLLAGGVVHDFNNLLTVIGGYSNLLIEDLPQNDHTRETVQEIRAAGERAANLTRQLLAFSRRQVLAPVVLALNDIVGQSMRMFQRLIGADIAIRFDADPALKRVKADLGQVEQALMNLIVNARDAMLGGGQLAIATRNETVTHSANGNGGDLRPGEYVRLSVSDTGCGIPADVQARIFEPFFTTKGVERGTGLGLAMVYGFVTQSGGQIAVTSTVGGGTTFDIMLPALDDEVSRPAVEAEAAPAGRCTETLLVVEDDLSVRQFVCTALRGQGYTILEAGDGTEALRVAEEHAGSIALLMTDVVMPEMGGRQLAEAMRTVRPGIKILFVSGYLDDAIARLEGVSSADNFLHKPFSPLVLARKIRHVLDAPA